MRFYFEQFRNGEVDDPKYQKTLIRNFLRAVYLYDDHIKITFDFDDDDTGVEIPVGDGSTATEEACVLISSPEGHHILSNETHLYGTVCLCRFL